MIGEDDCTARPIASIVTRHAPDRPQCVLFLNREDLGLSDRVVPSIRIIIVQALLCCQDIMSSHTFL